MQALLLDHRGVLVLPSPTAGQDFASIFGATLRDYRDANARAAVRLGYDPLESVELGQITSEEFAAAIAPELPGADVRALGRAFYAQDEPNTAMIEFVADLRARGIVTVLVVNAAADWKQYWSLVIPDVDEVFDHVVVSGVVGSRKPDPGIYRYALDLLAPITPAECVYVDDVEKCCAVAENLGMHAIHFTGTKLALSDIAALTVEVE